MNDAFHQIGYAAAKLAGRLPYALLQAFARAVGEDSRVEQRFTGSAALQGLPTPDFRDAANEFFQTCDRIVPAIEPKALALALITAAELERNHQQGRSVEIVWTGPEIQGSHFRHTEQALLEVLDSAVQRLTVVSYAVFRIPRIKQSLVAAAQRGVSIKLVIETPNRIEGQGEYDLLVALGSTVSSMCGVYYWPQSKRGTDANGKIGSLHVKCAVADGRHLFLSSANMTDYAFTINMELGCLISGGDGPGQIERHFESLISNGTLVKVEDVE